MFKLINIYLISTLLFLSISFISPIEAAFTSGAGTKVQANIPSKVDIRIYGYTAPNSLVQATSIRVFAQTSSDKTGYFLIDPLPISVAAKEICLTTIDSQQRHGFPLCVKLPETEKPTEIGPLLLAPTLSLSNALLVQNQKLQGVAEGTSIPNSDIEIYFFENSQKQLTLIPAVEAKSIPKLATLTDQKGNFSINLPTNKVVTFRVFAKAFYDPASGGTGKLPTPKSTTLTFFVSSYTTWWLTNVLPRLLLFVLFLTCLTALSWYEAKTKKGRLFLAQFNEKRLQPFGVRTGLKLRRIWYNLQGYLRSRQK